MESAPAASRKEWRIVSPNDALGHSDERTIYEVQQGRGSVVDGVDFFAVQMDGSGNLDVDDCEDKLCKLATRREELQQMEIELRARMIAGSEIGEVRKRFDEQIKEQGNVISEFQEQLHEREQRITELERKMDDKERELRAIRLDNEAAWAKEDLLREQSMELVNFRRDRDNIEAERAHHIKQIHELQELIQEKERQLIELQEQHRVAQETILYKDEQLREAQVWVTRVQEMDALQSNTNQSLQAQLRERTEQYNQLWLACQRQFAEMERLQVHTIQQLQVELAGAREKSGVYNNEPCISQQNSNDMTLFAQNGSQNGGSHLEVNENGTSSGNRVSLPNGSSENSQSFASSGNESPQASHVPGPVITPPSLLGVASYLPPGQVTAMHPYVTHQQGANHSVPAPVPHPHAGHFPSVPAVPSYQHWQVEQAAPEGLKASVQTPHEPSQTENNLAMPHYNYGYELSSNGQDPCPDHLLAHLNQATEANSVRSSECVQVLDSVDKDCLASDIQPSLQQISSQFHDVLRLAPLEQSPEIKENNAVGFSERLENKVIATEPPASAGTVSPSVKHTGVVSLTEIAINSDSALLEASASVEQTNSLPTGKTPESLLEERSLLSCIVRTIPAGGNIRISSTLPNRLGKMLAPLRWHDYKKKYGKLDDFVASHPELFVIEGDYIRLREGAQGIIAATAAVAKVAAAAVAATTPNSRMFPSVALTPMAQATRLKKIPSAESQHLSGASFDVAGGLSSVNGSGFSNYQRMGQTNGRLGTNFISKQEGREAAIGSLSRR